ncbi:MAG: hypothetical protein P4M05_23500 [Bradyrhizobium sp.]|nr:hypothetical protein [Bradyrhizobium sp.]
MFPKTGRRFPGREQQSDYASSIADALRAELGNSHQAIKTLMRWTGANERTTKNWLSGTNGPSGDHLLQIMRNSDIVFECVLGLVDRRVVLSHRKLEEVHNALQATAQLLSEMIQTKDLPRSH